MSTIHCRSFAIAATAILATAGSIAAQERPLGLLNEFEVRTLVARGEPVDLELEEYFLTLAKRYTTDANEHVTLALTYRGGRFAQAAVHYDRLANVARDAAKEATRAAGMHKQFSTIGR